MILAASSLFLAGPRVKNEGSLLKSVKEMFIFSVRNETLKIKLEIGRKGSEKNHLIKRKYFSFAVD